MSLILDGANDVRFICGSELNLHLVQCGGFRVREQQVEAPRSRQATLYTPDYQVPQSEQRWVRGDLSSEPLLVVLGVGLQRDRLGLGESGLHWILLNLLWNLCEMASR